MTEDQANQIIEQLEKQVEFYETFLGGYAVELFNVLSVFGILTCSVLLAMFIISSIPGKKGD